VPLNNITQRNEDQAAVSGDPGVPILAVRQDTLSSSVSADGDYGNTKLNADGALWVDQKTKALIAYEGSADAATLAASGGTYVQLTFTGGARVNLVTITNTTDVDIAFSVNDSGTFAAVLPPLIGVLTIDLVANKLHSDERGYAKYLNGNAPTSGYVYMSMMGP